MSKSLVPIIYKPGIQRDGTTFQGETCTDGQWIRFQRGMIKKMGGMKAVNTSFARTRRTTNLLMVQNGDNLDLYTADNTRVYRTIINHNFVVATASAPISPAIAAGAQQNVLWHSTIVIRNNVRTIVFMQTSNARNIAQTTASNLYHQPVNSAAGTQLVAAAIPAEATGGMCYSSPYLFIYGNNGYVRYSSIEDPLRFTGGTSGGFVISNDKVIYGANIRGGATSPSLLFWTMSSLVRTSNVGDATPLFKNEILSNSCSILSSRCVVEYDGMFFWPGTERFFVYNGVVGPMENRTNLNYFYDNLDMNKRQLVFGLKNQKYEEIWWFYPEKINEADLTIGCTRALIYNKRENSWYDVAISRDCGLSFDDLGIMVTCGRPLITPDEFNYVWRHETDVNQVWTPGAGGGQATAPIPSSFTLPVFSWASPFNPNRAPGTRSQAIERNIELLRIEPDFVMDNNRDDIMQVTVNTKRYAQSPVVSNTPVPFTRTTEKIDMRVQGRHMFLTFSGSGNFEMGNVQMLVSAGDGRA